MNRNIYLGLVLISIWSCKAMDDDSSATQSQMLTLSEGISKLENTTDLNVLFNEIADSRYVLLGEASHGTSEYYTWRAEISKRLIQEKGFSFIAVEGDWPDIYKLNQYIKGRSDYQSAEDVLKTFNRWPTWMWANEEIRELVEWLKTYNSSLPEESKVGFYGLDVYSLWESMEEIISYLDVTDPTSAAIARNAYNCFSSYDQDEYSYAQAAMNSSNSCADELSALLQLLTSKAQINPSNEAVFVAEQNALIAVNAEKYYTTSVRGNASSWNVRDRHMMETLNRVIAFEGSSSKAIVWEHNTHVGDARATDMAAAGEINLGQLVREQHEDEGVYIVGLGSYQGTVIASSAWGAETETMTMPKSPAKTWEHMLHETAPANKLILLKELKDNPAFMKAIGHRAIGVVYNPRNERGNYVPSILPERYDAFIFIDKTKALRPIKTDGSQARVVGQVY